MVWIMALTNLVSHNFAAEQICKKILGIISTRTKSKKFFLPSRLGYSLMIYLA